MTKKEMVYEIISYTNLVGLNQTELDKDINRIKKARIESIYNEFVKDREHAYFYYSILFML